MNDPGLTVGSKILVVDDKKENLDILTHILEGEGYEVSFAMEGEKAIQIASVYLPDLILLDVMMPGIDGPTTLQKLREYPHFSQVPVIFMTAKVRSVELEQYRAMGAIGVISKPFDPMTLAEEIHRLLENSHA